MGYLRDCNGTLYEDPKDSANDHELRAQDIAEEVDYEIGGDADNDDADHIFTDDMVVVRASPPLWLGEKRELPHAGTAAIVSTDWIAAVHSKEGRFGTLSRFTDSASFDAALGRIPTNGHDSRWNCMEWMDCIREFASDAMIPSFAASTGIAGMPDVYLPPTGPAAYWAWFMDPGGVLFTVEQSGVACDICIGCMSATRNRRQSPESWVYFIQAKEGGPVKIGRSATPEDRLAALQTAHPTELRIVATIPGGNAVERSLHTLFASDRIRPGGEWFRPSTQLMAFVRELKGAA